VLLLTARLHAMFVNKSALLMLAWPKVANSELDLEEGANANVTHHEMSLCF
jgi:hypothetical protein